MGLRDSLWEFWDPPNISRTVEAKNFKFLTETDGGEFYRKNAKLGEKRSCGGNVTLFSRERLKLETSNLAQRWRVASSNEENAKLGQQGSCGGHVTQLWNFGTALISRERLELATSILEWRRMAVRSKEKMQNWVKRGHVGVT